MAKTFTTGYDISTMQDHTTKCMETRTVRIGDGCIMDAFRKLDLYTTAQMQTLHRTQLYLQVTWLSETVTSDGSEVIDKYFKATARAQNLENDEWLQQPPPSRKKQRLWNKALTDTVCTNFKQLHKPFGDWITEDINWGARFNPSI
eukprot:15353903-Ditylum_brightwellii.AAC.1